MAIPGIENIIFKKPDEGIHCLYCNGNLKQSDKIKWFGKLIAGLILGKVSIMQNLCDNCKKNTL
jgi:hypothetical protein